MNGAVPVVRSMILCEEIRTDPGNPSRVSLDGLLTNIIPQQTCRRALKGLGELRLARRKRQRRLSNRETSRPRDIQLQLATIFVPFK